MPPIVIAIVTNPAVKSLAYTAASAIASTVAGYYAQRGLNKLHPREAVKPSNNFAWKRPWQV